MRISKNNLICSCKNLSKSYELFVALKGIDFSIQQGEKIGLVGENGAGKSTLLKILAGLLDADTGTITIPKVIRIAYIPQTFIAHDSMIVEDFIKLLTGADTLPRNKIFELLTNLALDQALLTRKIGLLSGGEKTKIALLRILLSDFDFYLLDEPTNNLDRDALTVLESFVRESRKTFLIVSHDRTFLDNTIQSVAEIDAYTHHLKRYDGTFTDYLAEREAHREHLWNAYSDTVKSLTKLEKNATSKLAWMKEIDQKRLAIKNLPMHEKEKPVAAVLRDQAGRAGHRLKVTKNRIERFKESTADIKPPREPLPLRVNFETDIRSGDMVFTLRGLVKKISVGRLGPIDLSIQYGDRVLISGANGVGKSTLIKIMLGKDRADSGEMILGQNVHVGYLPQQEDFLPSATVISEFLRHVDMEEGIARRLLNRFRITEADVHKKIHELSSGERSRLVLAIIMARKVNCLVLDEPSNHLDLEVLEELEKALVAFKGTLIVISHDRYFIHHVGFKMVLELKNGLLHETKL